MKCSWSINVDYNNRDMSGAFKASIVASCTLVENIRYVAFQKYTSMLYSKEPNLDTKAVYAKCTELLNEHIENSSVIANASKSFVKIFGSTVKVYQEDGLVIDFSVKSLREMERKIKRFKKWIDKLFNEIESLTGKWFLLDYDHNKMFVEEKSIDYKPLSEVKTYSQEPSAVDLDDDLDERLNKIFDVY